MIMCEWVDLTDHKKCLETAKVVKMQSLSKVHLLLVNVLALAQTVSPHLIHLFEAAFQ